MVTLASYFIDQLLREGTLLPLSDANTATHGHNAVVWYGVVRYVMCHRVPVSGVASMEQMEQLLPGLPRTTSANRANPMRSKGDSG